MELATALVVAAGVCAAAGRAKPPVPDLTRGDQPEKFHDWTLGPTGARGWIYGRKGQTADARQILVTAVAEGSPAAGVLEVDDVILGVGNKPFSDDARIQFARAVTRAEKEENRGVLKLRIWRVPKLTPEQRKALLDRAAEEAVEEELEDGALEETEQETLGIDAAKAIEEQAIVRQNAWRLGKTMDLSLTLPVMGTYSDGAPHDCPKFRKIFEQGCQAIAKKGLGQVSIPNDLNALALLASRRGEYRPLLADYARKVADYHVVGFASWYYGYATLFLAEYVAATGDQSVMPGLRRLCNEIARGASMVGTWGHGFATPSGRCGGYGCMNSPGIVLTLALVVGREAGVKDPEVDRVIAKSSRFLRWYVNKGAIPYGDHNPWPGHEDNGKNSAAAVLFDVLGDREAATYFAKTSVAAYDERERGHTGNFFNILWALPGVSRCGPPATGAYWKKRSWYYDFARGWDGSFRYQGSPQGEEEHYKYTKWDCTGAYMLAYALPLKSLYLTGRKPCVVAPLTKAETSEVIAAGRDYFISRKGDGYKGRTTEQLLAGLSSWSPIVRKRSAQALARQEGDLVPTLLKLLASPDRDSRYGACEALGCLGPQADRAAPQLRALLADPDPWMQSLACTALLALGPEAYNASVPDLLRMAVRANPTDPRQMAQRAAAKALFGRHKGPRPRIAQANLLKNTDRQLLYAAVRAILQNEDGRTRADVAPLYGELTDQDLKALMPDILRATEELAPSGIMFASVIRMAGLEVLARHRVSKGIELLADYARNQKKHGSQRRIVQVMEMLKPYGSHAKRVIPQLKATAKYFETEEEGFPHKMSLDKARMVRETIKKIEASTDKPDLIHLGR